MWIAVLMLSFSWGSCAASSWLTTMMQRLKKQTLNAEPSSPGGDGPGGDGPGLGDLGSYRKKRI